MGEAKNIYFTCLNILAFFMLTCPTNCNDLYDQNVEGQSSRTQKVHGQEVGAPDKRWATSYWDAARIRPVHESGHRRMCGENEKWRNATSWHGSYSWQLHHHVGRFGSDLSIKSCG